MDFLISPEDSLIVRAFGQTESLRDAARLLKCDPAGLVRKAQRISKDHDLLHKVRGKWLLSHRGRVLVTWLEESIQHQKRLLQSKTDLRIGSTAWLCEEMLIPQIPALQQIQGLGEISISTPNRGLEVALLESEVDFIIACHPPENPTIAHKKIAIESWVTVVPAAWSSALKNLNTNELLNALAQKPFIRHNRLNPESLYPLMNTRQPITALTLDHLAGVRASIQNGLGWSAVPRILVQSLIRQKKVVEVALPVSIQNDLCLWWLRERAEIKKLSLQLVQWTSDAFEHVTDAKSPTLK